MHVNIVTPQIKNSSCHRLFGVDMDCQLSFGNHINPICTDLRAKTKAREMKFFIEDFFSKCDQFRRKLLIWSHLLKKSLMENLIFCAYFSEQKKTKTADYWRTHFSNIILVIASYPAETAFQKGLSKFIEISLQHGCFPINLLHVLRTPFSKNTSGGLFQLSWMFHGCKLNNKKNRLHERFFASYKLNIQVLITELYKVVNGLSLKLVSDSLKLINMTAHSARNRCTFCSRPDHTVLRDKELFSHLGPEIWKVVSNNMKYH